MTRGNRELKVLIFDESDMKSNQSPPKSRMQSKTHRSLRETESKPPKNSKQMKSTTRGRRRLMNRRLEFGEDASLKLLATVEVPIADQLCKLIIFLEL
jgi:hypothetical protein